MSVNDNSRIVIDSSRVMLQIVASLTDDSRGVNYNRNVFIYTIMVLHCLSIYTSEKHYLLSTQTFSACASLFRHPV